MDAKQLGTRIKEARLSKRMTQSDVVGTFITRNMLSQIESGIAVPSMKTLNYLANVLSISPSELIREEKDNGATPPEELLLSVSIEKDSALYLKAKGSFQAENYTEVLSILSSITNESPFYEEASFLKARSACILARERLRDKMLADALSYAKLAEQASGEGFFASESLKKEALQLLAAAASALASPTE